MEYMNVSPKSTTFKHKDVWRILEVFLVGFSLIRVLCLAYFDSGKMSRISCFYELRTNQWSVFSHYVCTCSVTQSCPTLCNPWTVTHQSPLSMEISRQEYCNNGVGCHFFLHGIFPTQGSNSCLLYLLHWQEGSLLLSHVGSLFFSFKCGLFQILKLKYLLDHDSPELSSRLKSWNSQDGEKSLSSLGLSQCGSISTPHGAGKSQLSRY